MADDAQLMEANESPEAKTFTKAPDSIAHEANLSDRGNSDLARQNDKQQAEKTIADTGLPSGDSLLSGLKEPEKSEPVKRVDEKGVVHTEYPEGHPSYKATEQYDPNTRTATATMRNGNTQIEKYEKPEDYEAGKKPDVTVTWDPNGRYPCVRDVISRVDATSLADGYNLVPVSQSYNIDLAKKHLPADKFNQLINEYENAVNGRKAEGKVPYSIYTERDASGAPTAIYKDDGYFSDTKVWPVLRAPEPAAKPEPKNYEGPGTRKWANENIHKPIGDNLYGGMFGEQ